MDSEDDSKASDEPGSEPGRDRPDNDQNQPRRCPHCGGLILPEQAFDASGGARCPHCRLTIDEGHLA